MINIKILGLLTVVVLTVAIASPVPEEPASETTSENAVPKGKSLVFSEPLYSVEDSEMMPEYQEPLLGYYDGDVGRRDVALYPTVIPSDMDVAESNIVFRPLFAYRKQMERRRRVYLQQKVDKTSPPKRRGYYYYYGYPVYYHNRPFDHVS